MYPPEAPAGTTTEPGHVSGDHDLGPVIGGTTEAGMGRAAAPAAIAVGMIAASVYQRGAFYPLDAFGVVVVSLILVVVALRRERDTVAVVSALVLGGLAAWWLSRAVSERGAVDFLPFGASLLGFLAAFLVSRRLARDDAPRVAMAVVAIGALSAAGGLAGVLGHWHALAQQSGHYWEVATTLTYPAAAAVLFMITLLIAVGLDVRNRLVRAAMCICLAGLIGTQMHWDLLALAAGTLVITPRRWLVAVWPLVMGLLAGLVVVASGAGRIAPWLAGAILIVIVSIATLTRSPVPDADADAHPGTDTDADVDSDSGPVARAALRRWLPATGIAAVVCGIVLLMVLAPFGHGPRQAVGQSQTQAWSASADAWRTSVLSGVGPPRIATSSQPVATYPGFAADGYLAVTADGGLVGIVLLVAAGATIAGSFKRRDPISSCAAGAAIAFAVAGAIDFDWQLPALGLLGGCVAGLASQPRISAVGFVDPLPSRRGWRQLPKASVLWTVVVVTVVATQVVVGSVHTAGGQTGGGVTRSPTASAAPPPSASPDAPGRTILSGPWDATDPYMLTIGDHYFLYTSEGETFMNVPLRIASRLGHWGAAIDVLPQLPGWAQGGLTWAPDVHKVSGGWALYFTSLLRGVTPFTHCIGSAFSSSPEGPFVASPHPFICQRDHRGSIDARVVALGNRLVMLWKSDDNANPSVPGPDQGGYTGIFAQNLSANGKTLLGSPVKILSPSEPWEGTIVESPDMIEAWGTYWLFFSGNWYNSPSYAIGVAACDSPLGPCADSNPTPFLGSNLQGVGPGESSLFEDGSAVYLLYNPFKANDPGPVVPRPVSMARVGFAPDGPYLAGS